MKLNHFLMPFAIGATGAAVFGEAEHSGSRYLRATTPIEPPPRSVTHVAPFDEPADHQVDKDIQSSLRGVTHQLESQDKSQLYLDRLVQDYAIAIQNRKLEDDGDICSILFERCETKLANPSSWGDFKEWAHKNDVLLIGIAALGLIFSVTAAFTSGFYVGRRAGAMAQRNNQAGSNESDDFSYSTRASWIPREVHISLDELSPGRCRSEWP